MQDDGINNLVLVKNLGGGGIMGYGEGFVKRKREGRRPYIELEGGPCDAIIIESMTHSRQEPHGYRE